jgi:hypothetical protein
MKWQRMALMAMIIVMDRSLPDGQQTLTHYLTNQWPGQMLTNYLTNQRRATHVVCALYACTIIGQKVIACTDIKKGILKIDTKPDSD